MGNLISNAAKNTSPRNNPDYIHELEDPRPRGQRDLASTGSRIRRLQAAEAQPTTASASSSSHTPAATHSSSSSSSLASNDGKSLNLFHTHVAKSSPPGFFISSAKNENNITIQLIKKLLDYVSRPISDCMGLGSAIDSQQTQQEEVRRQQLIKDYFSFVVQHKPFFEKLGDKELELVLKNFLILKTTSLFEKVLDQNPAYDARSFVEDILRDRAVFSSIEQRFAGTKSPKISQRALSSGTIVVHNSLVKTIESIFSNKIQLDILTKYKFFKIILKEYPQDFQNFFVKFWSEYASNNPPLDQNFLTQIYIDLLKWESFVFKETSLIEVFIQVFIAQVISLPEDHFILQKILGSLKDTYLEICDDENNFLLGSAMDELFKAPSANNLGKSAGKREAFHDVGKLTQQEKINAYKLTLECLYLNLFRRKDQFPSLFKAPQFQMTIKRQFFLRHSEKLKNGSRFHQEIYKELDEDLHRRFPYVGLIIANKMASFYTSTTMAMSRLQLLHEHSKYFETNIHNLFDEVIKELFGRHPLKQIIFGRESLPLFQSLNEEIRIDYENFRDRLFTKENELPNGVEQVNKTDKLFAAYLLESEIIYPGFKKLVAGLEAKKNEIIIAHERFKEFIGNEEEVFLISGFMFLSASAAPAIDEPNQYPDVNMDTPSLLLLRLLAIMCFTKYIVSLKPDTSEKIIFTQHLKQLTLDCIMTDVHPQLIINKFNPNNSDAPKELRDEFKRISKLL